MKKLLALAAAAIFCIGAGIEFMLPKEDTFTLNVGDSKYYWSPSQQEMDAATIYRLQNGVDDTKAPCDTNNHIPARYGAGKAGWASTGPFWFCTTTDESGPVENADFNGGYTSLLHSVEGTTQVRWYKDDGPTAPTKSYIIFNRPLHDGTNTDGQFRLLLDKEYTNVPNDRYYICAPMLGVLKTSHYACDYGHEMQFEFAGNVVDAEGHSVKCDHITMTIKDATCWYCCRNKKPEEGEDKSGVRVVDGKTFYQANTKDSLKGRQMDAGSLLVVANKNTSVKFTVS